ncbi:hypothetical protein A3Q35_16695 [Aeribacillus pallidus]|nr:hypothetical protein A3Q35_16695 [Aeribacillus pallidus]
MKWGKKDMQSKTSLFKKELLIQNFRSVGWVGLAFLIGLILSVPMEIAVLFSGRENYNEENIYESLFSIAQELQLFMLIVIPVLMSIFLFRFLHVKQSSDFLHSLPINRKMLFWHHWLTGVVFLIVPVMITSLILAVFIQVFDLSSYFRDLNLVRWFCTYLAYTLLLFSIGTFSAMLTGISTIQAILTLIILLFPFGVYQLIVYNLQYILFGFPSGYYLNNNLWIEFFSPLTRLISLEFQPFSWWEIAVYLLLAALFCCISLLLYTRRPVEYVSQAVIYWKLKPFFKYGATFCTMLLGGMYFGIIDYRGSLLWICTGYVVGALIGYFIAEMILQQTWRIKPKLKGLFIYFIAVILVFILTGSGAGGYEKKVPRVAEIQSVFFSNFWYFDDKMTNRFIYKEPKIIEAIQKLHTEIVAENRSKDVSEPEPLFIVYYLKNGSKSIRQYEVDRKSFERYLKEIYESKEYKKATYEVLDVNDQDVEQIVFHSNYPNYYVEKVDIANNSDQLAKALKALKNDITNLTYEDMTDERKDWGEIEIILKNNKQLFIPWKKSFKEFDEWMKNNGTVKNARVTADDVQYVLITENNINHDLDYKNMLKEIEQDPQTVKIVDKQLIEQCLQDETESTSGKNIMFIVYKNGNYEVGSFAHPEIAESIKKQAKK